MSPPVVQDPYRLPSAEGLRVLERLRDADRLLDAAPRTLHWELLQAANDRVAMIGSGVAMGVVGGLAAGLAASALTNAPGAETPGALREYHEALLRLGEAARLLGEHPAARGLRQVVHQAQCMELRGGAPWVARYVRSVHPALRHEFGAWNEPPLVDWSRRDAEDEAACKAAGVGWRPMALRLGIGLAIVTAVVVVMTAVV